MKTFWIWWHCRWAQSHRSIQIVLLHRKAYHESWARWHDNRCLELISRRENFDLSRCQGESKQTKNINKTNE